MDDLLKVKRNAGLYTYMNYYCGRPYKVYVDTTLTIGDVYELSNGMLLSSEDEVKEQLKNEFLQETEHRYVYIVAHINPHENQLCYEESYKLDAMYHTYYLYTAKWYNSKAELLQYLMSTNLTLNDTVILEYDVLYLQKIMNNDEAQLAIRTIIRR